MSRARYTASSITALVLAVIFGLGIAAMVAALEGPAWAYLIAVGFFAIFGALSLMSFKRRSKFPTSITVTPTAIAIGDRTLNFAELYVIELPAPGLGHTVTLKIMTSAGEKIITPLVQGNPKAFPDYDSFADLIFQAGNSVKPLVNYTFSGH